jgi:PAS domain S-box-containing protein
MSQQDASTSASAVRQRLYDVTKDKDTDIEVFAERLLSIGREYLGVDNAHIERIDDGGTTHEVVASVNEPEEPFFAVGERLEAAKTFCRHTIERETSLAIADATEDGFADDPAYLETGAQCYLGASIVVDGETYGTVCFVDPNPQEETFSASERGVVELIARLLERRIERQDFEERLADRDEALARSERKYETLLDAAPGAIFLVGAESRTIVEANDAATTLTGYSVDALQGKDVLEFHPDEHREQYRQLFDRIGDAVSWIDRFPDGTPLRIRRNNGTNVPIEIGAERIVLGDEPYVHAIVRDISAQRRRECRLRSLHEASRELLAAEDRETVARTAVEAARDVLGYDLNGIHLLDDDGETLAPVAVTDAAEASFDCVPVLHPGESVAWDVFESGERVMTDDVREEPAVYDESTPVQSELVLPLGEHGVFVIASQSTATFTEANTSLASVLATTVEAALDQVQRKQALKRSRDLLQRTEELADTGGWMVDTETDEVRWSTGTRRLFGVDAAFEPTLSETFGLFDPEDQERLEQVARECAQTGSSFDEELQAETATGEEKWVRVRGAPVCEDDVIVGVSGAIQDITERKERERELRVRTRAIDAASIGITIADATTDGRPLIYANREFERITGYDREAIRGQNCRVLQGPDTDEESVSALRAAIDRREPITLDLLNYRADGTPFWNELTLTPVTDEAGSLTHFVGFQQDITMRKRRERLVSVLNRVLRHNLRNDMTVVRGNAELLANRHEGTIETVATEILETTRDLTQLSEKAQTLETAMRDPDTPAPRDVVADIEAAVESLPTADAAVDLTVDAPSSQQVIGTDRIRLAIEELGQNAIQHGGDEPSITYRVTESAHKDVAVHVTDDGPGLETAEQEVLRTGDESPLTHGSGLGLWLVNWIVTSVGGSVTATVDDGTTVTIHLPAPGGDRSDEEQPQQYWQAAITSVTE